MAREMLTQINLFYTVPRRKAIAQNDSAPDRKYTKYDTSSNLPDYQLLTTKPSATPDFPAS